MRQYRRKDDKGQRVAFVRMGSSNTGVVIAQGLDVFFVKYIDVGGDHLDDAVAAHFKITPDEAAALRRPPGDRRTDRQDPEVVNSVVEATRPLIEKLANELALCIRYHSVTFRGQAIRRLVLGGSEAVAGLAETLASRLNIECDLGDPLQLRPTVADTPRSMGHRGRVGTPRFHGLSMSTARQGPPSTLDFLPTQYRQRGVKRRTYTWRVAVAGVFAALFVLVAIFQQHHHQQVRQELADTESRYAEAVAHNAKFAKVQAQLQQHRHSAELLTYLRHPWPRTPVIAAVVAPLTDGITLTDLQIAHETVSRPTASMPPAAAETKPVVLDRPARLANDLKRLVGEHSVRQDFVLLTGYAVDASVLHEYLARLGTDSLFSKIDLLDEHAPEGSAIESPRTAVHFNARAILRNRHGQVPPARPSATVNTGGLP